jgi:GntR family transcriptional regulator, transcriptional repressor for pyruvate dehydrogenase complex
MMINSMKDYKEYSIADYQFHLNIAKASKNRIFYRAMINMKDILFKHFEEMNREFGPEMSMENHRKIFAAIREKDPQLAAFLIGNNIELSMNKLKELIK